MKEIHKGIKLDFTYHLEFHASWKFSILSFWRGGNLDLSLVMICVYAIPVSVLALSSTYLWIEMNIRIPTANKE